MSEKVTFYASDADGDRLRILAKQVSMSPGAMSNLIVTLALGGHFHKLAAIVEQPFLREVSHVDRR